MNCEGYGRKHQWPNRGAIRTTALRDCGKSQKKKSRQNSRCPDRDTKGAPPVKPRALQLDQTGRLI
jgi:hypothetical protein